MPLFHDRSVDYETILPFYRDERGQRQEDSINRTILLAYHEVITTLKNKVLLQIMWKSDISY